MSGRRAQRRPFRTSQPDARAEHVVEQLGADIDLVLDGGRCAVGVESTIVRADEGGVTVLRLGELPVEEIEAVAGPVRVAAHKSPTTRAPGMLPQHYAPRTPIELVAAGDLPRPPAGARWGLLAPDRSAAPIPRPASPARRPARGARSSFCPTTATWSPPPRLLFDALHRLDALGLEGIAVACRTRASDARSARPPAPRGTPGDAGAHEHRRRADDPA